MQVRFYSLGLLFALALIASRSAAPPAPAARAPRNSRTAAALKDGDVAYFASEKLCEVSSADVCESSGLVRSLRNRELLWTHNDSGGAPAIVAFDRTGRIHGVVKIAGAVNRDWEEITAFRREGEPWLVVADCGNNFLENRPATLYFLREPSPDAGEAAYDYRLDVFFESGPINCEAMEVDEREGKILFFSKVSSGRCEVFEASLPDLTLAPPNTSVIARRIAAPHLTLATGMCISADGSRMVVVNYQHGFEFRRGEGESWASALTRPPRQIELSWRMPQREAVCFDEDDCSLLMTSEARQGLIRTVLGANANFTIPLWRVPAKRVKER